MCVCERESVIEFESGHACNGLDIQHRAPCTKVIHTTCSRSTSSHKSIPQEVHEGGGVEAVEGDDGATSGKCLCETGVVIQAQIVLVPELCGV